jgi:hypothetical protein
VVDVVWESASGGKSMVAAKGLFSESYLQLPPTSIVVERDNQRVNVWGLCSPREHAGKFGVDSPRLVAARPAVAHESAVLCLWIRP